MTRRLREQMERAAAGERYEEAASLRDQVQALLRLEAPQKITTTDIEERDLFAAHVEGERAAVQVFCVRDGKVVAREGFLLDRLTEPELVLASTLQQFYAGGRYVPREVVVPEEIPDRELLEAWLAARRGTLVRIHVPQRGEKLRLLELVVRNAQLAFELEWKHPRQQSQEILRALRDLVDLEVEPRRIECFDISNIQGSDIVASMVVFEDGLPKKADYRKFRVKSVSGAPDDFASMREVVGRRYKRLLEEGKDLPDLVLIDGGKGQLGAAVEALEELGLGDQPVVSLAKREELIFVRGRDAPIALPRSSPVLQLVQRVRDEAHRFAVGFHRQVRSSRTIRSELDDVPGVGPAKRRKLLSVFGSAARRARRDRGRAGRGRGQGHGRAPARPLRRDARRVAVSAGGEQRSSAYRRRRSGLPSRRPPTAGPASERGASAARTSASTARRVSMNSRAAGASVRSRRYRTPWVVRRIGASQSSVTRRPAARSSARIPAVPGKIASLPCATSRATASEFTRICGMKSGTAGSSGAVAAPRVDAAAA